MKIEIELDDNVVAFLKKAVVTRRIPEVQVGPRVMNTPSEGPQVAYGYRAVDLSKEHWPQVVFDYALEPWPTNDTIEGVAASYVTQYVRLLEDLLEEAVEGVWYDGVGPEWRGNPEYFIEKFYYLEHEFDDWDDEELEDDELEDDED